MADPAHDREISLETEIDKTYGYRTLKAAPSADNVREYFRAAYYADIEKGEKAADIARALKGGADADDQATWMQDTLYADIGDIVKSEAPGRRVLEIGCGLGDLLLALEHSGMDVEGVEIAPDAAKIARERGLTVHGGAFEDLVGGAIPHGSFDAVLFINVLEQLPDPKAALETAYSLLGANGVVLVRSGNDFNPLQLAISKQLGHGPYWVVSDHLSYFTYESLGRLLGDCGFDVAYEQSDFPMELMALLGFDYISDPSLGSDAHARRVAFERRTDRETRRRLYRAFAAAGLGRCLLMAARKREP